MKKSELVRFIIEQLEDEYFDSINEEAERQKKEDQEKNDFMLALELSKEEEYKKEVEEADRLYTMALISDKNAVSQSNNETMIDDDLDDFDLKYIIEGESSRDGLSTSKDDLSESWLGSFSKDAFENSPDWSVVSSSTQAECSTPAKSRGTKRKADALSSDVDSKDEDLVFVPPQLEYLTPEEKQSRREIIMKKAMERRKREETRGGSGKLSKKLKKLKSQSPKKDTSEVSGKHTL
eukprot:CAMPEP_0168515636 /NCGR_PEP_ID=MMETSP0405-20121227/4897_1 /TAXON_ID=498012 /ORGANISM="Trichosphaerium sp, Strain Am-I-7 wt" /LENGTH=235 /DNA_ID=CAMNT_0008535139 /DNA_START=272 /DNA_END=975 /DNA_ORIENTATION=+